MPYSNDNIQKLSIEASELQINSEHQLGVDILSVVIGNHAPFPQALPALQFSIVNAEDQLIASRIFTALDYLQEEDQILQFIESQCGIETRLNFDIKDLDAIWYRLQLLLLYL